jgi:hypothetical protein
MAVARASMALGRYHRVVEVLHEDKKFAVQAWLDNLVSGALFTGASNWVWQELPRGFMLHKALFELEQVEPQVNPLAILRLLHETGRFREAEKLRAVWAQRPWRDQ